MLHSVETAATRDALARVLSAAAELRLLKHPSLLRVVAAACDQPHGQVALLSELAVASLSSVLAWAARAAPRMPAP